MIKDTNYIHIPGWASTKLGLKGNALLIYSIIYGFSQNDSKEQCYKGSIDYLVEWTNSTRQGVERVLGDLLKAGYITKIQATPTNVYKAVELEEIIRLRNSGTKKNLEDTPRKSEKETKKILDNNINNTINNNIDDYTERKKLNEKIEEIVKYLNKVCGTSFRPNNSSTKKVITTGINEGYEVDDFKRVIDFKYNDWGVQPYRFKNGRMSTEQLNPIDLFGKNFEKYYNNSFIRENSSENEPASTSIAVDSDISDFEF